MEHPSFVDAGLSEDAGEIDSSWSSDLEDAAASSDAAAASSVEPDATWTNFPEATGVAAPRDAGISLTPAAAASAASSVEDEAGVVEVTSVSARRSKAQRMMESAEAVKVVDIEPVKRESSDLGDVLARTPGVAVRRMGGLGSDVRFSLNGLQDDQIRFFLDGVPLELTGYAVGIANVPVNLLTRAEIYSGVVPIRFGADALGGAVNLVTDESFSKSHAGASYQTGSFGLYRASAAGQYVHKRSGFFARTDAFFDKTRNDYWMKDVRVTNSENRLEDARVQRFHDAYQAWGAGAEVGVARKPWAKRLSLRGFYADYDKQIQHDIAMFRPYGAATFGRSNTGATLRYERDLAQDWSLNAVAGYTYTRSRLLDITRCVYDWFGDCRMMRRYPGELASYDDQGHNGADQIYDRHAGYARLNLAWHVAPDHTLRLSSAPTYFYQTGENRRIEDPDVRDPSKAPRILFSLVNGLEYQIELFAKRLQSIVFVKHYYQSTRIEAGGGSSQSSESDGLKETAARERHTHRFGAGFETRYRFTPWLLAKATYEWATRLPRAEEVLGDTLFLKPNLDLKPEQSQNANLGPALDYRGTKAGDFRGGATGFLRDVHDMIVLLAQPTTQTYQNLYSARSTGIEAHAGWTSPRSIFSLDGNFTWQRFVNTSKEGAFAALYNKQLPHRPSLFANLEARLSFREVITSRDEISLVERTNWIAPFDRGWGGAGQQQFKFSVPKQLVHALVLSYAVERALGQIVGSVEGHNLSDEKVFDFYGVQKPGRAFYAKLMVSYR